MITGTIQSGWTRWYQTHCRILRRWIRFQRCCQERWIQGSIPSSSSLPSSSLPSSSLPRSSLPSSSLPRSCLPCSSIQAILMSKSHSTQYSPTSFRLRMFAVECKHAIKYYLLPLSEFGRMPPCLSLQASWYRPTESNFCRYFYRYIYFPTSTIFNFLNL